MTRKRTRARKRAKTNENNVSNTHQTDGVEETEIQQTSKRLKVDPDTFHTNNPDDSTGIGHWQFFDAPDDQFNNNANNAVLDDPEFDEMNAKFGADVTLSNPSLVKYYAQRYRLWSLYDEGIWMDETGWFSVTPELIAQHLANRCCGYTKKVTVIDAFAGVGGNSIQFALHENCERVIAIDIDETRLMCAKHNAQIYGVADKIEFICADYFQILKSGAFKRMGVEQDCLVAFLSPPWGGPEYLQCEEYDIETMIQPINGKHILALTRHYLSPHICYLLPRNTPPKQVGSLARPGEPCEYECNYLNTNIKTVAAYYGGLVLMYSYEDGSVLPVYSVAEL
jgi:trimethylguanosine synthase